jgi:hypothetical protein
MDTAPTLAMALARHLPHSLCAIFVGSWTAGPVDTLTRSHLRAHVHLRPEAKLARQVATSRRGYRNYYPFPQSGRSKFLCKFGGVYSVIHIPERRLSAWDTFDADLTGALTIHSPLLFHLNRGFFLRLFVVLQCVDACISILGLPWCFLWFSSSHMFLPISTYFPPCFARIPYRFCFTFTCLPLNCHSPQE